MRRGLIVLAFLLAACAPGYREDSPQAARPAPCPATADTAAVACRLAALEREQSRETRAAHTERTELEVLGWVVFGGLGLAMGMGWIKLF